MDLTSFFTGVSDPRRAEGKRTPLPAFWWMSFLAIASGSTGYRAMSRFARGNAAFFQQHFGLRHAESRELPQLVAEAGQVGPV